MTRMHPQVVDTDAFSRRRLRREEDRQLLNNLPLAHRLAEERAGGYVGLAEYFLGQALVGLVEAADTFDDASATTRFGAWAEPIILDALDRIRDEDEVEAAQSRVAAALAGRRRTQELASFLDVPVEALVGGIMDAAAQARQRPARLRLVGAA